MGRPKAKPPKNPGRKAKAHPAPSTQHETPLFCLKYADRSSGNPWKYNPEEVEGGRLHGFMLEMAGLTWAQIESHETGNYGNRHKKHHDMPVSNIVRDAQGDLTRRELDKTFDGDIFRFRLGGRPRLWGFRRGRIFHAVWWDFEHDVYPADPN